MVSKRFEFTPWLPWASRQQSPYKDKSGVYLIARFLKQPPSGPADPLEDEIVYIGESCKERLQSRWRSFDRAAFRDGKHRGGKKYKQLFGGTSTVLFVATFPDTDLVESFLTTGVSLLDINRNSAKDVIDFDFLNEIDDLIVKYMERRLILLYSLARGHRPLCNVD